MASTASIAAFASETVLGKRKSPKSLVLHLVADSSSQPLPLETSKKTLPILVNGLLVPHTNKRYKCTYSACEKFYSKPSRLAEHERSHTGQRPFVCNTCNKSYLRESHLQAHAHSHLPASVRPLVCPKADCGKRFWTAQHLRVHANWHNGLNSLKCPELGCDAKFAKNHQLRAHICSAHSPPGTKPYRCEHEGCTRSFATNQHLHSHLKVHDDKRYTCVHMTCLARPEDMPTYFPTWSALQCHIRTVHPPTCTHPSCQGRTFTSQKGLRSHLKLHEERELENEMRVRIADENEAVEPPRKRRRGGEIGRDWKCDVDGCDKDFKSKRALANHINVTHLGRRDHVCPYENCKQAYGYKHLLQRHLARVHESVASDAGSTSIDSPSEEDTVDAMLSERSVKLRPSKLLDIDTFTGQLYAKRTQANVADYKAFRCPYPHMSGLSTNEQEMPGGPRCEYAFSRAYDLRRHLKAEHNVDSAKEKVAMWVRGQRGKQ